MRKVKIKWTALILFLFLFDCSISNRVDIEIIECTSDDWNTDSLNLTFVFENTGDYRLHDCAIHFTINHDGGSTEVGRELRDVNGGYTYKEPGEVFERSYWSIDVVPPISNVVVDKVTVAYWTDFYTARYELNLEKNIEFTPP